MQLKRQLKKKNVKTVIALSLLLSAGAVYSIPNAVKQGCVQHGKHLNRPLEEINNICGVK